MAKFACPKNDQIQCDSLYLFHEFYRQIKLAYEANNLSFVHVAPGTKCAADPELCPRYLAFVAKQR